MVSTKPKSLPIWYVQVSYRCIVCCRSSEISPRHLRHPRAWYTFLQTIWATSTRDVHQDRDMATWRLVKTWSNPHQLAFLLHLQSTGRSSICPINLYIYICIIIYIYIYNFMIYIYKLRLKNRSGK